MRSFLSVPRPPWLGSLMASPQRRMTRLLLVLAWGIAGVAWCSLLGLHEWQVRQRPAIMAEAFLSEMMTLAQVESLSQAIQSQPYFCDVRLLMPDEALAEARAQARLRPLLDAFGGNPFLRSFRLTICAGELEGYVDAEDWLREQPGVAAVRVPVMQVEYTLERERWIEEVVRAMVALATTVALLVMLAVLRLMMTELSRELTVYEELGAKAWLIWIRAFWAVGVPAVWSAVLVTVLMALLALGLSAVGGSWNPWAGAPLPKSLLVSGGALVACALAVGLFAATASSVAREYRRPG